MDANHSFTHITVSYNQVHQPTWRTRIQLYTALNRELTKFRSKSCSVKVLLPFPSVPKNNFSPPYTNSFDLLSFLGFKNIYYYYNCFLQSILIISWTPSRLPQSRINDFLSLSIQSCSSGNDVSYATMQNRCACFSCLWLVTHPSQRHSGCGGSMWEHLREEEESPKLKAAFVMQI